MRGARISYSETELAWIKACCDMARTELHALFVQVFGRQDVSFDNIKSLCSRRGWQTGPDGRRRNAGKSLVFTPDQAAWLRANASLSRPEVGPAFAAAFPGTQITADKIISWRKRNRIATGRTGRFEKGGVSHNKGKKGFAAPGSEKGWFRKGHIPHTARGVGHESIDDEGYVWMIVAGRNPHTGADTRRVMKHRWLWEQANGPVPAGHALKCLDGDKTNTDPSNWECIPRALLPRLNGRFGRDYDHVPAELKPTILAIAKLEHKARELRRTKA
jgi:HNH endonuclease